MNRRTRVSRRDRRRANLRGFRLLGVTRRSLYWAAHFGSPGRVGDLHLVGLVGWATRVLEHGETSGSYWGAAVAQPTATPKAAGCY